jgi:DNA-binding MarR family transcriptional regulator
MRWIKNASEADGLTIARLRLLWTLETQGPLIMSDLKDALGVTARSVTSLVDGLEEAGHVRRRAHPEDRRATIVEPTAAGREAVLRAQEGHREQAAVLFEHLDEADRQSLLRIMRSVIEQLEARHRAEGSS